MAKEQTAVLTIRIPVGLVNKIDELKTPHTSRNYHMVRAVEGYVKMRDKPPAPTTMECLVCTAEYKPEETGPDKELCPACNDKAAAARKAQEDAELKKMDRVAEAVTEDEPEDDKND